MKQMKKLNATGFAHHLLLAVVVVGVACVGTYYVVFSKAATVETSSSTSTTLLPLIAQINGSSQRIDEYTYDASTSTTKLLNIVPGTKNYLGAMAYSPNGKFIAWTESGRGADDSVKVYDRAAKTTRVIPLPANHYNMAGLQWNRSSNNILALGMEYFSNDGTTYKIAYINLTATTPKFNTVYSKLNPSDESDIKFTLFGQKKIAVKEDKSIKMASLAVDATFSPMGQVDCSNYGATNFEPVGLSNSISYQCYNDSGTSALQKMTTDGTVTTIDSVKTRDSDHDFRYVADYDWNQAGNTVSIIESNTKEVEKVCGNNQYYSNSMSTTVKVVKDTTKTIVYTSPYTKPACTGGKGAILDRNAEIAWSRDNSAIAFLQRGNSSIAIKIKDLNTNKLVNVDTINYAQLDW